MKITFMHEGLIQEITPPDFATNVVIKTRPNGISVDYESSTVQAVQDYLAKETPASPPPPVKNPELIRGSKGKGWKLTDKDRDAIVKAWAREKPQPTYDVLAARYGVHRTTVAAIIYKSLKTPFKGRPVLPKPPKTPIIGNRGWSTTPISQEVRNEVVKLNGKGVDKKEIAAKTKISLHSVERIIKNGGRPYFPKSAPTRKKGVVTPFMEGEIARLAADGAITRQAIADRMKVNISTVTRILAKQKEERLKISLEGGSDGNV